MRRTAARRFGAALAASAVAHLGLGLLLGLAIAVGHKGQPVAATMPVDLVAQAPPVTAVPPPVAPPVAGPPVVTPPPPAPPPAPPAPPPAPPVPPPRPRPPQPSEPEIVRAPSVPMDASPPGDDAEPAGERPDAAPAALASGAPAPGDGGPPDDGGLASVAAGGAQPAGPAGPASPVDPRPTAASADLAPYAPGGARLLVVVRADRLRGTPFAGGLEGLLAPLPDYRTLLGGTGASLGDVFDLLVIATPDPTDVTATFLAAQSRLPEARVVGLLTGDAARPRVHWQQRGGVRIGERTLAARGFAADRRLLAIPAPGWLVLAAEGQLAPLLDAPVPGSADPGPPAPPWLERLRRIAEDTDGAESPAGPLAVVGVADVGGSSLELAFGITVAAPERATAAVYPRADGSLVLYGTASFADAAAANAFVAGALRARREAIASLGTRLLLETLRARTVVEAIRFETHGATVWFRTTASSADARALVSNAGALSKAFFEGRRARKR